MTNSTSCESTSGCPPSAKFHFDIPRFSATASQLVEKLNQGDTNVPSIIQLIECEPTISSQVLRLANSPIYGASRVITTIGHAIVVLGFRCVSQQAIAAASGTLFKEGDQENAKHRMATYVQSLGIATAARFIAKQAKNVNPDEAFLGGVVHDVGKLVLFQYAGMEYAKLLEEHPHEKSLAAELEAYGISHTTLGRQCGIAWSLPHHLCASIEDHHVPPSEASAPLTKTLVMASYLAKKWQLGFEQEIFAEDLDLEQEIAVFESEESAEKCREEFQAIREICLS
ncbi:MAG: HDOD domain-containing protein [Planctomycetota bacterium]